MFLFWWKILNKIQEKEKVYTAIGEAHSASFWLACLTGVSQRCFISSAVCLTPPAQPCEPRYSRLLSVQVCLGSQSIGMLCSAGWPLLPIETCWDAVSGCCQCDKVHPECNKTHGKSVLLFPFFVYYWTQFVSFYVNLVCNTPLPMLWPGEWPQTAEIWRPLSSLSVSVFLVPWSCTALSPISENICFKFCSVFFFQVFALGGQVWCVSLLFYEKTKVYIFRFKQF